MQHRDSDLLRFAVRAALLAGIAGTIPAYAAPLPTGLMPVLYDRLAADVSAKPRPALLHGCSDLVSQKLHACFSSHGADFQTPGDGQLHLALTALGRGTALQTITAVKPVFGKDKVEYLHPGVTEWWRGLPVGYEQGFTLPRRPAGVGRLTLQLTTAGRPRVHGGDLAWQRIHYSDLEVYDARHQRLSARFEVTGDSIAIRVDDRGAKYPLTVDPLVWVQQKGVAVDGAKGDGFGYAVAAAGDTVAVGAPSALVDNAQEGAVYLFTQSNGIWTQSAKLTADVGLSGQRFGAAVAMTSDTLLIGAPYPGSTQCGSCSGHISGPGGGVAYVFKKSATGIWTKSQVLSADNTASPGLSNEDDRFGAAVAISGTTLVVGAPEAEAYLPPILPGIRPRPIIPCNTAGTTPIVKSYRTLNAGSSSAGSSPIVAPKVVAGAAYVFTETGGHWQQTQKLSRSRPNPDGEYGYAVAVSSTNIAVGAPFATAQCNTGPASYTSLADVGLVDVYSNSAGYWNPRATLQAPVSIKSAEFGFSLALSGDTLAVGAPAAVVKPSGSCSSSGAVTCTNISGSGSQGAVFLFSKTFVKGLLPSVYWTPADEFVARDGHPGNKYGYSVALDGTTLYVGAPLARFLNNQPQGELYIYDQDSLGAWEATQKLIAQDGAAGDSYAFALAALGNTVIAGAPNAKVGNNTHQGAVYFDTTETLAVSVGLPASIHSGGSSFTATVTVTNAAPGTSGPLTLALPAPSGVSILKAATPQGTCGALNAVEYTCVLNGIPGGGGIGAVTLSMFAKVASGTTVPETASITDSKPGISATANTNVVPNPNASSGAQDFWSLGFLASLLMLRVFPSRRRAHSG